MNTAKNYNRLDTPSMKIRDGAWTTLPQDQGQSVHRSYSGRDGGPGFSAWLRVVDYSYGTCRYYRRDRSKV